MKSLTKINKLKSLILPKMTYLITFLDNTICAGGNIHRLYPYLEIIISPTNLTSSGQLYYHFGTSSSTKNEKTLQPAVAYLCVQHKVVCELCGRIGHKADACTFCGPNFLPPSPRINVNYFNTIHGNEQTDTQRE